ncbi:phosphotransferase family protein [Mycobacterium sp. pUA109]|uniref:phosphotransferase family protein n=1 Tax=Mycobacterium sp. pUA109 TaxID=3238982 RepID=UPI00351AF651
MQLRQDPAPAVPDSLAEALSPQWLTAALGVEVRNVVPGPVVDRISTNARFTIECDEPLPAGLSTRLCVKGYFNEIGRAARFVGEPEAYFYRDLAPAVGVRTLQPVYADVDPETRHGVVVSVDVAAHGGRFLDGTSPFTADQAADSLGELAALHAATWCAPHWSTASWLAPRMGRVFQSWGLPRTMSIIASNLHGPNGSGLPRELRDADRLVDAYRAMIAGNEPGPWCVIHGDAHVGNLFVDASGRPGLLDWQLVQRGGWSIDVGYHLASALTVKDRRSAERDLLQHYLDRVRACGVEPPDSDSAWCSLRCGILHGLFLWSITTQVDPAIIEVLLHRLGTAAADHSALELGIPR